MDAARRIVYTVLGAGDPGAVYKLAGGGSSGDASRSDYVLNSGGAKVPLVRDTLLCDRFALVDGKLRPVLEACFKRSRHVRRGGLADTGAGQGGRLPLPHLLPRRGQRQLR
ncbi:hypothetical protein [Streptomyces sp. NPDC050600]|uniref:hypothetical protein n=1 Tax=Streptomyces sp. NPDC050600 TaxID=3157213 RepID=UPI003433B74D